MAGPRSKKTSASRGASVRKRAALRDYTLHKEQDGWYAEIGGTRCGPMRDLDEVDDFAPKSPRT
jgi:hypothetical protein